MSFLALVLALPLAAPLRVGTSGDCLPFSGRDAGGRPVGLEVEIVRAFAREHGMEVRFTGLARKDLLHHLRQGRLDVVACGIPMRPEHALFGHFARPHALTGAVALVRREDRERLATRASLDRPGVRIAVPAGGHLEEVARRAFPHATRIPVADSSSLPSRVLDGRADALVTDSARARHWMRPELFAVGPFSREHRALLLARDSPAALMPALDAWLVARERDGWLNAQRRAWLGEASAIDFEAMNRQAIAARIGLRLGLMPGLAAVHWAMGLPLGEPGQERRVLERVRRQARHAERVEALYPVLLALSRRVQNSSRAVSAPAGLEAYRRAIARIDEALVRDLDSAKPAAVGEWFADLEDLAELPGLTAADVARLAAALPRAPGPPRSPPPR